MVKPPSQFVCVKFSFVFSKYIIYYACVQPIFSGKTRKKIHVRQISQLQSVHLQAFYLQQFNVKINFIRGKKRKTKTKSQQKNRIHHNFFIHFNQDVHYETSDAGSSQVLLSAKEAISLWLLGARKVRNLCKQTNNKFHTKTKHTLNIYSIIYIYMKFSYI